jgi:hypothetical protein
MGRDPHAAGASYSILPQCLTHDRGSDQTLVSYRWRVAASGSILDERWGVTPDQLERAIAYCLKIVAQSSRSSYTTSMPSSPTAGNSSAAVFQGEPAFDRALIQAVRFLCTRVTASLEQPASFSDKLSLI